MKGIVFTEFLTMVDDRFGAQVTERIIAESDLPSGGAYTSVGTYDHGEIVTLVTRLSAATEVEVSTLVQAFGKYLLQRFTVMFPTFFADTSDVTAFLAQVHDYIHVEVRKLYPDATLPHITTQWVDDAQFLLDYRSERMMGDLAEGLIAGAIEHFGNEYACARAEMDAEGAGQWVRFTMTRHP